MDKSILVSQLEESIKAFVKNEWNEDLKVKAVDERSKVADLSSIVPKVIAGKVGMSPYEVGMKIVESIPKFPGIKNVVAEDNGFINFYLDNDSFKSVLNSFDDEFGSNKVGNGKKVMVEFGQPNTHKALQLGHFKSAITGLAIARMYENNGYEVIKANYFGDIGLQVSNCIWGVINRNGTWYSKFGKEDLEEIKTNLTTLIEDRGIDAAALYLDQSYVFGRKLSSEKENVLDEVKDINKKIYDESDPLIMDLYHFTRDISIKHQDKAFKELGVEYDVQYPESVVWKLGKEIVLKNLDKVFVKDDGAIIFEGEKYGLQRWVFLTSAGFPSYSGKDLGLAVTKFKEYPDLDLAIVTTSVEQNAYFRALIKALELVDPSFTGKYMHVGFGWLLFENKKMSSKTGKNVKYTDLIEQAKGIAKSNISNEKGYSEEEKEQIAHAVAMGALKFAILSHEFHKDINWDIDKFMSMSGFAAPYILYSYARGRSILDNCNYTKPDSINDLSGLLESEVEMELLKKLAEFPGITEVAGKNLSPHMICRYVFELSELFNRFYGEFNISSESDSRVKEVRLRLVDITTQTIKRSLYILGIDTVEQM